MSEQYQISPRRRVAAGEAVRVYGKRGVFRFMRVYEHKGWLYADVIGPVGGVEIWRTYPAELLRPARGVDRLRLTRPQEEIR